MQRRDFLTAIAAVPFAVTLSRGALAQGRAGVSMQIIEDMQKNWKALLAPGTEVPAATHYMGSSVEISEVMHRGAITTTPDTPLTEAAMAMVNNKIGGLPVVKGGKVVGIITETDVFRAFVKVLRRGEVIHHAAMIKGKARKHTPTPNKARKAVATKSARKAAAKK